LHVICPGFSADCLETIEEIDAENRGYFMEAGGKEFHYIPALNSRDDHLNALTDIIQTHLQGWPETDHFNPLTDSEERSAMKARAQAMRCPF
jgi:ferrochelatase